MLDLLLFLSCWLVILSGLVVIALGRWHKFGLKFAGVVLETVTSAGILTIHVLHRNTFNNLAGQELEIPFALLLLAKNLGIILLTIASGRDAIRLNSKDRRCTHATRT